ncbi:MAG TPA: iron ABC transporter permease [Ilumatobacter sp.]|nr:iron ABC transporter permease [Ilumatobacter sp.]
MTARPLNALPRALVVALATAPTAFLLVFYAWPFVTLLAHGLRIDAITETLRADATWRVVWFTVWQAVASTAATLVLGMLPAWALARYTFPGRRLLYGALTAVFVLPTVVVGAAFVALLPESLDRSVWAIVGAHVVFNLAVVVRTVGASWSQLPYDLEHAAATLGAGPVRTFRSVTLPLLRPAVVAAGAIVFLFTFTSFGVIRVLGGVGRATIEVEVWRRATQLGDVGRAATLTVLQLCLLAGTVGWAARSQRRHTHAVERSGIPQRRRPRGRQRWLVAGTAFGTALVIVAPLAALVERSFRIGDGYSTAAWRSLDGTEVRPGLQIGVDPIGALTRSLTTAAWATLLALVIGAAAVVAIDALGRSGRVLDTGLMLPLGTSAVTIGFGMLITFDTPPVDWRAEWWLVPVGHALVAAPFVVRGALGVLRSVSPELRNAAATLGASPVRAWAATTLPFIRQPLLVGAGLAAAISLGEFGATSFLSRSGEETLPLAIERLLGRTGGVFQAQAFALSAILAVATIVVVLIVDLVAGSGERARRR